MSADYDECKTKLGELVEWYSTHVDDIQRNEATTRLHLIDRLFIHCLAWAEEDVIPEESHEGKYADYVFHAPRRILIVEAKKEGDYFSLPAGKERLEYSLKTLCNINQSIGNAINQAIGYCHKRGVPFGVVCNGHQIIAFIATRIDGVPPLEGKSLVFPSLKFMDDNFFDLWQYLSKPGIQENNIQHKLIGDLRPTLPSKLSSKIMHYPGVKDRNVFQTDLQIVSELIIEDITRSRELEEIFLEECYCKTGAFSQYSLMSKAILKARYAALFDSESPGPTMVPATDKRGLSADLVAESISRRPILLLGDVGVGKTTFIRHLMKVEAAALFEDVISIYLDLGSQATLTGDIKSFILDEIVRQLRKKYDVDVDEKNFVRGIYNLDIKRFKSGIFSDLLKSNPELYKTKELEFLEKKVNDKEQHLRSALEHISKGRKKQIVIFIDNADQRDEDIQQIVFLIAQELAEHWPVTVFVALRPETFHVSKKRGVLTGYHPKAFTISPPRTNLVIEKRLAFALKLTRGEIPIRSLDSNVSVCLSKLESIIKSFLYSLGRNKYLGEFIDNISGGNVRLALDLVKGFFGSGHVDTWKIYKIYESQGSYTIPLHEFLRAVIFGDSEYYNPGRSPIANLFDVTSNDPKEHFLLPLLLGFLSSLSGYGVEEGFVETEKVYEKLQGLGFLADRIDQAVHRGFEKNLIITAGRRIPVPGKSMPSSLRITPIGYYHIARLCSRFEYIDSIIIDTPIFDPEIRRNIHIVDDIKSRIVRTEYFRHYLNEQWASIPNVETAFHWYMSSRFLRRQMDYIESKVS